MCGQRGLLLSRTTLDAWCLSSCLLDRGELWLRVCSPEPQTEGVHAEQSHPTLNGYRWVLKLQLLCSKAQGCLNSGQMEDSTSRCV